MGTVKKRGKRQQATYRGPDGKEHTKTFDTVREGRQWNAVNESAMVKGSWVDPRAGRKTFKEYAEEWRNSQVQHRAGTAEQIKRNLENHVYPRLGSRQIKSIGRSDIQELIGELATALSPSTIAVIHSWNETIFKSAVADWVIRESPCRDIKIPTVSKARVRQLSVETVEKLAMDVLERYEGLILLGAGTGVRISEALGLTVDRVDWVNHRVTIDRQLTAVRNGEPVFGPVKDRLNRPRTIPMPRSVLIPLTRHRDDYRRRGSDLGFVNERGEPIARSTWSDIWRRAASPLGIEKGDGYHQLRHFYASLLIKAGESVKVVQERLGHTSATMTLDIYGHLWPDDDETTRGAVDGVLGGFRSSI